MLQGEQGRGLKEGELLIPERKMAGEKRGEGTRKAQRPGRGPAQDKSDSSSWRFTPANTPVTVWTGETPDEADRREACRLRGVTFSGGRAGRALEPTEALERDVSTFQDAFINLPLILQAPEVAGSPIGFPLHCVEVGRIYTKNNVILKGREKRGEKKNRS